MTSGPVFAYAEHTGGRQPPSTEEPRTEDLTAYFPDWVGQLKLYLLGVAPLGYLVMLGWLVAGRPWLPRPSVATPDLGPEPPALVAMMYNRWRVGETAAVATLLDLAARRFVELNQVGGDTVVRLRDAPPGQRLTPWEQEILGWVSSRTVANRGVQMAALQAVSTAEARDFHRRYTRMIRAEAQERGLSTRKPREMVEFSLFLFAMVSAATIVVPGTYLLLPDWRWWLVAPIAFFALLIALILPTGAPIALRDWSTPDGRASLSRWLGVKAYLDATPQLQALPPAAVTVWGRYLAYAAALGSAPLATRTLAAIWTGQPPPSTHTAAPAVDPPPIPPPRRDPDVRLGGIAVFGGEVLTPAGSLPRSEARWNARHTGAVRPRLDPAMFVVFVAFMCMFPLNLFYLLFALERRYVGTVEVTVAGPSLGYTTQIPFDGDEEYTAVRRALTRADDLLGTSLAPPPREDTATS